MKQICKLVVMLLLTFTAGVQAQLVTYPESLNPGIPHNDDYTVRVRIPGGEWKDLFEYNVQVDMDNVQKASMVQFDMGSVVEVMVKKNNGSVREVTIRPLSKGIEYKQVQNAILFTLEKPQYLSFEFDGDRLHNLHLFANPLETEKYDKEAKGIMYFSPGVHRPKDLPNNQIRIPGNTIVYLAPGAVVKAKLLVDKAENVRIIGRGILDHPIRGIEVTDSKNVLIDGITVVNPEHYTIFGGGSTGITMQNSTLWADVAHPIFIGLHGDAEGQEVMENLNYINIDILDHKEKQIDYQGCMAINIGDNNLVRNVRFENIRIEDFRQGQLVNLRIFFNKKYCAAPGRGIENVLFKDITYNGENAELSIIAGYNEERKVKNIRFENLRINGEAIYDDMPGKPKWYKMGDMARFFIGEHVEGVTFTK